MRGLFTAMLVVAALGWGCAMFGSWKSIPPPGGCDQCHTKPIGNNWQIAYSPATLTDETGRNAWQKPQSVMPPQSSPMEQMKVSEERCFRCHKSPSPAHTERAGRYHH